MIQAAGDHMQRVKNQHYVSQFCLRRFTADGTSLWVFDKPTKRVFRKNVDELASEDGFYDLSPEFATDYRTMDKALGHLEDYAAPAFEHLIHDLDHRRGFNHRDEPLRRAIATFVVIQDVRTRLFRDQYVQKHDAVLKEIERRFIVVPPAWPKEVSPQRAAFEQARFMLRKEYRRRAVAVLMNQIWIVGRNDTDQPLYFSDAPVTRYSHVPHPFGGPGLATIGIQIDFPLSSRYVLMIHDRAYFGESLAPREGRIVALDDEKVKGFNGMQVWNSRRQVYCSENRFDLVRHYAQTEPEWFDADRQRFEIL
jgi:hypothetical protein